MISPKERLKEHEKKELDEGYGLLKDSNNIQTLIATNRQRLAEAFKEYRPYFYDINDNFYLWNHQKNCYEVVQFSHFLKTLKKITKEKEINWGFSLLWGEFERCLKITGDTPETLPKECIQFKNKIINLKTGEEFEATPKYYCINVIPHNIGISMQTPLIDKMLGEWVNKENVEGIKENIAFSMLRYYPIRRFFILYGGGANGKTSFMNFKINVLGENNCVATDLDLLLNNRFEAYRVYQKLYCVSGELSTELLQKTDVLKRLTGDDIMRIEQKFKNAFDMRNYAKFDFATNTLPEIEEDTKAIWDRLILVMFPNIFTEKKNPILNIPEEEYENLCSWCVSFLKKLLSQEEYSFKLDRPFEEKRDLYKGYSEPIRVFLKENFIEDLNSEYPMHKFCEEFNAFLSEKNLRSLRKSIIKGMLRRKGFKTNILPYNKSDGTSTMWSFILSIKRKDDKETPKISEEKIGETTTIKEEGGEKK